MPFRIIYICLIILIFSSTSQTSGQTNTSWQLTSRDGILLDLTTLSTDELPISENIEMSGKRVSAILYYDIDTNRIVSVSRNVIYPQLRTFVKTTEPAWKKYRAYLQTTIEDGDALPAVTIGDHQLGLNSVDSIEIDGTLILYHTPQKGILMKRTFIPDPNKGTLQEYVTFINVDETPIKIEIGNKVKATAVTGHDGIYQTFQATQVLNKLQNDQLFNTYTLTKTDSLRILISYGAIRSDKNIQSSPLTLDSDELRQAYLSEMRSRLVLETPDPVINQLFEFSKIRAAESIFESTMGLIHSPGGGNYYVGTWANDQVEYSGPFFPYLGYETGNKAAYNTYKKFLSAIPEDSSQHLPYAFEVNGNFVMDHLDRGDAAMVAYGTSHYLLARGDIAEARELWPLIEWSLAYCKRMQNAAGAVQSESDEMEGRIPTGDANLSTSSLYYGGLKYARHLAAELGKSKLAAQYDKDASTMQEVINTYFAANIEGLDTYRYFEENNYLRHWICLPLVMGINERAEGTLEALFEKLWTDNGILVELNPKNPQTIFWDRATLYALRGAFKAGAVELATDRLTQFSKKRLLGDHVPYVIEAYPENNMKHLSAESALYCRVITEGLLGIEPTGLNQFNFQPRLPKEWNTYSLTHLAMMSKDISIKITRVDENIQVVVHQDSDTIYDNTLKEGETITVNLIP